MSNLYNIYMPSENLNLSESAKFLPPNDENSIIKKCYTETNEVTDFIEQKIENNSLCDTVNNKNNHSFKKVTDNLCVVCKCVFDNEIINGKIVCKDYTCWDQPTCKEKLTGIYKCNFCKQKCDVNTNRCNLYYDEDINILYKYICDVCYSLFLKRKNLADTSTKWNLITDENIISSLQKNNLH